MASLTSLIKRIFLLCFFLLLFLLWCFKNEIDESSLIQNYPLVKEHSIIFVGDIMLSRGVDSWMKKEGYLYPFENIAEITKSANITFGNLESPLSTKGEEGEKIFSFRGNPEAVRGLVYAGFNVVNLANNHSCDYGKDALLETIELLRENDIHTIGAGMNLKEAREPALFDQGDLKIAFLGYDLTNSVYAKENRYGVGKAKTSWIIEDIKKAKEKTDLIIISFHWGEEYEDFPTEYQKNLAQSAIDFGADIVVGHHAHTFQGIEMYKGKLIVYNLGNFIFDQRDVKNNQSFILKVNFKGKRLLQAKIIPVELLTYHCSPKVAEGKVAQEILDRLYYNSSIFGTKFTFFNGKGFVELTENCWIDSVNFVY